MDIVALAFLIAFEGSLIAAGILLLVTYVAFARMNKDVRRARMFIMADRVKRFLGAFTVGFLLIAVDFLFDIAGAPAPAAVSAVVILLFLASILYGSVELFLIVRPRRSNLLSIRKPAARSPPRNAPESSSQTDPEDGDPHAAR